jgi:hypothetical protein
MNQNQQRPQTQQSQPPKQVQEKPKNDKTDKLKNYIERAFEKCQNDKERQIIEKALKKILNQANLRGEYHTKDWDTYPLPMLPRESKVREVYCFNNRIVFRRRL